MKWTQIFDIAISLQEKYPTEDIMSLSFTKLNKLVLSLEDFDDDPKHCNEKILEAIQQAWIDER